ncbi:Putative tetratricopeptide-like helical domain superfamily [Septoria linicola]|uniref:Tetratricopeptide-like helical domain superfamily n=1 Tax=Septoria linicola TaxID=215465 RepID=A0A9Q9EGL8_9PEZI|nr:putative tetratricopeptide-like helical domain superfamily [Septoria linicola]USW49049.1 Putative tetratricopeptide-like helical domain superfamily [Septoria linicola]
MQCTRGALQRPLRDIIKSIGHTDRHSSARQQHVAVAAGAAADRGHERPNHVDIGLTKSSQRSTTRPREYAAAVAPAEPLDEESKVRTVRRQTDAPVSRLKEGAEFGQRYFRSQLHRHQLNRQKATKGRARLTQRDPDTWKQLVHLLDKATPGNEDRYKRVIETVTLPDGVAAVFTPSKEVAILEIMQRTGCHMQMVAGYAVQGRSNAFTGIALQGTRTQNTSALSMLPQYMEVSSIETAETRSSRLQKHELHRQVKAGDGESGGPPQFWQVDNEGDLDSGDQTTYDTDLASPSGPGLIRSTWTQDRLKKDLQSRHRVHNASVLRSPSDFGAYVADLISTGSRTSTQPGKESDAKPKRPLDSTMRDLVSVFTDTTTSHLATTESIGRAFEFLAKHSYFAAVRQILKVVDEEGRNVGPMGYNALLTAAANAGDLHNLEHVLRSMRRRGRSPGAMTWATLHGYICETVPREADIIVQLMRAKGLFADNAALRVIVMHTIKQEFTAHIQKQNSTAGFLAAMDERMSSRYGRADFNWFTVDVLNRMLHVLVTLGRMQEAVILLEDYRRRGKGAIETATLNTILSSTSRDHDAGSAIAALKLFRIGNLGAVMPDRFTYQTLFMIAWRRKYYNMLRVVWRYACAAKEVTSDMKHRLGQSLVAVTSAHIDEAKRATVFSTWAGKFVVGITRDLIPGPHLPYDTSAERDLTSSEERLVNLALQDSLERGSSTSKDRRKQLSDLLHDDLEQAGNCKPLLPLTPVLERAWHKDLRWEQRGLGIPARHHGRHMFNEMLLHAIRVPMRPGDFTKHRKWEVDWLLKLDRVSADEAEDVQME